MMSAEDRQLSVLRGMSAEQKLRVAQQLYDMAWQIKAAALRSQHPDWRPDEIQRAVREIFLYART